LSRPDADPRFLTAKDCETAHEKTVKSVVWLPEGRQIVSGGEDGVVKYVYACYQPLLPTDGSFFLIQQLVGFA
jgi:WD40 repeat protein